MAFKVKKLTIRENFEGKSVVLIAICEESFTGSINNRFSDQSVLLMD